MVLYDDFIAEIRESVSNNRIKSGYENRTQATIDMVPHAGARAGTADGIETSEPSIANTYAELEDGETNTARLLSPPSPKQYVLVIQLLDQASMSCQRPRLTDHSKQFTGLLRLEASVGDRLLLPTKIQAALLPSPPDALRDTQGLWVHSSR
ncbi:hypothetical protein D9615_010207 [Tricholomella constricta]|uniref:Uncharacterized protein n=1 Tax=Tricholomella constricta TaxID=117010 RepID=A0A8H5GNM1_9AGAR|nr:hypothetical protein D9615_010207 [Tricholomella constricta]